MANDRRHIRSRAVLTRPPAVRRRPPGEARPSSLDWPAWLALLERHRRTAAKGNGSFPAPTSSYFVQGTCSSFRLEGIHCTEQEVIDAITPNAAQRRFRARTAQRIRNHIAILHSVERALRLNRILKSAAVLRWYTSVGSGLSANALGASKMSRLEQVTGRINSPQLRLQPAILEIARTYSDLLSDPLFPSFNGILARLLLQFHLGRCGLPGVVFDQVDIAAYSGSPDAGVLSLLNGIEQSYELILNG